MADRGGRRNRARNERELLGLVLIVVGAFWLLGNLHLWFLSWGAVWPLAIVAVGIALVLGTLSRGQGAGVAGVAVPREAARRLEVRVNMYGGRLALRGESSQLLEASSPRTDLRAEVRRRGADALVRLNPTGPAFGGFSMGAEWDVAIPSDVPVTVRLAAGAGEFRVDLSSVALLGASLSVGACHVELMLPPPTGDVTVAISAGAAGIDISLPPGIEAQVTSTGLTSVNGIRETRGYAAARDRLTVRVSGGAAQVNVRS